MSLTDRTSHFDFGANWSDYAQTIDQERIDAAVAGMKKLFPDGLDGKTFLDIGCGSGLHSLAALSLGAKSVVAIDIDEDSVRTTREVLSKHAGAHQWSADVVSIFDAEDRLGQFDVVYSWGVLHHTGDMWRAIDIASSHVAPNGQFALAIYAKTRSDRFWIFEKRLYSKSPKPVQWLIRQAYSAAFFAAHAISSRENPLTSKRAAKVRGMNVSHDVHDWLGGYPYETAGADELIDFVEAKGFRKTLTFMLPFSKGRLGSGCHEAVFLRR